MGLERGRTEGNRQQQYAENPEAAGQAMCHRYHRSLSSTRSLRWRDFSEAERQGAADPLCRREALERSAPAPGFLLQGALVVVDVLPAVAEPNVRNGSRADCRCGVVSRHPSAGMSLCRISEMRSQPTIRSVQVAHEIVAPYPHANGNADRRRDRLAAQEVLSKSRTHTA